MIHKTIKWTTLIQPGELFQHPTENRTAKVLNDAENNTNNFIKSKREKKTLLTYPLRTHTHTLTIENFFSTIQNTNTNPQHNLPIQILTRHQKY